MYNDDRNMWRIFISQGISYSPLLRHDVLNVPYQKKYWRSVSITLTHQFQLSHNSEKIHWWIRTAIYLSSSHLSKSSHVLLGETSFQESFAHQLSIPFLFQWLINIINKLFWVRQMRYLGLNWWKTPNPLSTGMPMTSPS